MVKLNKKILSLNGDDEEASGIDWQQLMANFQSQSVEEALKNIMDNIAVNQNVEFDQICLILKHYLLLDTDKSYLNHFLKHDQNLYLNMLIERFNASDLCPNVQWMISELLKVLTSVCDKDQALLLLNSEKFRSILCTSLFDTGLLLKLKSKPAMTNTQVAILTNLFETISNLCEVYNPLIHFVTVQHIEWMADALVSARSHKEFIISIARLLNLFSEYSDKDMNNNSLNQLLLDLYVKQNYLHTALSCLSECDVEEQSNTKLADPISNNLNAKLYLINSFVNAILSVDETDLSVNKAQVLMKLVSEYGKLFEYSLNIDLCDPDQQPSRVKSTDLNEDEADEDSEDLKCFIKTIESGIECKLLAIDLIKLVLNYFIKEDQEDDSESEEIVSDDEMDESNGMEVEATQTNPVEINSDTTQLKIFIQNLSLLKLLIKTVTKDNENIFQDIEKIDHISNSINLIRLESLNLYLIIAQNFYANTEIAEVIEVSHMLDIMQLVLGKPVEDLVLRSTNEINKYDLIDKLACAAHEIYSHFNVNHLNLETKCKIVDLIKQVLLKFKLDHAGLCIKLVRVLTLMAIKERNTNLADGYSIVETNAKCLLEVTAASFELNDQTSVDTLVLNAELLDLVIDLFGEDNLASLEASLNFNARMQSFGEKFYSKYKSVTKNRKIKKENSLIVKTVRDNLKLFIAYKTKNSVN